MKFTKVPFGILAKDLERRYNVKIVIESKSLREEAFTGSFTPSIRYMMFCVK